MTTPASAVDTAPVTPDPTPTPAQHASRAHRILSALEGVLGVAASPEVLALLPAKYRGYVLAAAAVEHVATTAISPP